MDDITFFVYLIAVAAARPIFSRPKLVWKHFLCQHRRALPFVDLELRSFFLSMRRVDGFTAK
jgi:hypothetical protein